MFKWLGMVLLLAAIAASVLFANRNMDEVTLIIPIPGMPEIPRFPLYGVIFTSLFIGFIGGAVSSWLGGMTHRRLASRLQRQNKDLEKELTNLRNLPLEDDIHP